MLPQYDNTELIANIKRRCSVPTSQLTFTTSDIVKIANDVLQDEVVPLLMSTREEYFVEYYDATVTADRVIPIPANAVGAKLRSVCFVQQSSPVVLLNLPRIDLDVVAGLGSSSAVGVTGFYVQGNNLILYPATSVPVGTIVRLYFYRRTLVLADEESYGRIESIDTGTNTVVLDFVPYDWEIGTEINAVSSLPSFKTTNALMAASAVSSPSIILDNVTDLSVGDYLSITGYSAIAQIPVEAHGYLAQLTAVKLLEGLGDRPGMEVAQLKATDLKEKLLIMISQRVDGSVKKVMHPNGGLRAAVGGLGRGWGGW